MTTAPEAKPVRRRKSRAIAPEETALWRQAMRDAEPLRKRNEPGRIPVASASGPEPAATKPVAPKPHARPIPPPVPTSAKAPAPPPPPLAPGVTPGLDKRSAQKLRRGQYSIDARLDLHGLTQAEAHARLRRFLVKSQDAGCRCVLVVTGKGTAGPEAGVLRRELPRWLNQPDLRPLVLALEPALPRDGGLGAVYLLLRKKGR